MSDSVTKYFELVEEGYINPDSPTIKHNYSEKDLARELVSLAREHKDVDFKLLYVLAKTRLTLKG